MGAIAAFVLRVAAASLRERYAFAWKWQRPREMFDAIEAADDLMVAADAYEAP